MNYLSKQWINKRWMLRSNLFERSLGVLKSTTFTVELMELRKWYVLAKKWILWKRQVLSKREFMCKGTEWVFQIHLGGTKQNAHFQWHKIIKDISSLECDCVSHPFAYIQRHHFILVLSFWHTMWLQMPYWITGGKFILSFYSAMKDIKAFHELYLFWGRGSNEEEKHFNQSKLLTSTFLANLSVWKTVNLYRHRECPGSNGHRKTYSQLWNLLVIDNHCVENFSFWYTQLIFNTLL